MATLTSAYFNRPTLVIARELLGKRLVRRFDDGRVESMLITEVEAYDGFDDKASHASRGRTERNAPMFGSAGHWYVYLCYGMHWMLNIVTGPKDYPAAVLIRSTDEVTGPARLTKRLGVDRRLNGLPARRPSGLWIEDGGAVVPDSEVSCDPRIGVDYAGPVWSKKPWRFTWQKPSKTPAK